MSAPDPSRGWIALGSEAAVTVASCCLLGWWGSRSLESPIPLVLGSLVGVILAMARLLAAAK